MTFLAMSKDRGGEEKDAETFGEGGLLGPADWRHLDACTSPKPWGCIGVMFGKKQVKVVPEDCNLQRDNRKEGGLDAWGPPTPVPVSSSHLETSAMCMCRSSTHRSSSSSSRTAFSRDSLSPVVSYLEDQDRSEDRRA